MPNYAGYAHSFYENVTGAVISPDNALGEVDGVFTENVTTGWHASWAFSFLSEEVLLGGTQSVRFTCRFAGAAVEKASITSVELLEGSGLRVHAWGPSTTLSSSVSEDITYSAEVQMLFHEKSGYSHLLIGGAYSGQGHWSVDGQYLLIAAASQGWTSNARLYRNEGSRVLVEALNSEVAHFPILQTSSWYPYIISTTFLGDERFFIQSDLGGTYLRVSRGFVEGASPSWTLLTNNSPDACPAFPRGIWSSSEDPRVFVTQYSLGPYLMAHRIDTATDSYESIGIGSQDGLVPGWSTFSHPNKLLGWSGVAVTRDCRYIAVLTSQSVNNNGLLLVFKWNIATSDVQLIASIGPLPIPTTPGDLDGTGWHDWRLASWSRDGKYLAVGVTALTIDNIAEDPLLYVYKRAGDSVSLLPSAEIQPPGYRLRDVRISPKGGYILVTDWDWGQHLYRITSIDTIVKCAVDPLVIDGVTLVDFSGAFEPVKGDMLHVAPYFESAPRYGYGIFDVTGETLGPDFRVSVAGTVVDEVGAYSTAQIDAIHATIQSVSPLVAPSGLATASVSATGALLQWSWEPLQ